MVDAAGLRAALAAQRGHPLVVNFWATWCAPCVEEFPDLVAAARAWRGRGVRMLSVSADDTKDLAPVRGTLARFGGPFSEVLVVGADPGPAEGIMAVVDPSWTGALPSTFVYDASGRQVQKRIGHTVDRKTLDQWLRPLVKP